MHPVEQSGAHSLRDYRDLLEPALLEELEGLGDSLRGARIAHVNATAHGGGVAEILHSLLPLYRGLGIDASWLVMEGDDSFFSVTKALHNALQGAQPGLTGGDWDVHAQWNRRNASSLGGGYDAVIVNDPQPVGLPEYARAAAGKWVWRCHIDTSTPEPETWERLGPLVQMYDAAVFSLPEFVGAGLEGLPVSIMTPAIDPFTPKNSVMPHEQAMAIVAQYGLDPSRPFITQVSRFDPWKDPLGVIESFKQVKRRVPSLQLALLGNFADDDPEGMVMYQRVHDAAQGVPDVHLVTGLSDLVGPFQSESRVVVQKSLREGFGLTCTEALWKGTPVVAGNVGGLRLQVSDGVGGYLVDSVDECAERVTQLLENDAERTALGASGRERVRRQFLMPRLLRDEMRLLHRLLNDEEIPSVPEAAREPAG